MFVYIVYKLQNSLSFAYIGFSGDGFDNFHNDDDNRTMRTDVYETVSNVRGRERVFITLPTVIEKAREFFDCDDMLGVELEDYPFVSAQVTSHWENRIMLFDTMIRYTLCLSHKFVVNLIFCVYLVMFLLQHRLHQLH